PVRSSYESSTYYNVWNVEDVDKLVDRRRRSPLRNVSHGSNDKDEVAIASSRLKGRDQLRFDGWEALVQTRQNDW
ncbi:hypothetical protein, partial [Bacteroides uniformis]|uniref:hypothetical protein n=1 Tax=Bacteroides uniformis TaxID=820 RepID=UPI001EDE4472